MKRALLAIGLVSLLAVGCQNKNADGTADIPMNGSVVDVTSPAQTNNPYEPVAPQPVVYDSMVTPQATTPADPSIGGGGSSHTIQKGDTLYSIAKARYGDGKQWTRIADANPGLDPTRIPVGKTIVIP